MTTPTADPVPSNLPQNLLFNAEKTDEMINSAASTFIDRLGVERPTAKGIAEALQAPAVETAAFQSKVAAEGAAAIATTASAASTATAHMFKTSALGVTGTADGGFFSVPGTGNDAAIIYQRVGSAVVEQPSRVPSSAAVEGVTALIGDLGLEVAEGAGSSDGRRYSFGLKDLLGYLAFGITDDGEINLGSLYLQTPAQGFALSLADDAGNAVLTIDHKGNLWHAWQQSTAPKSLLDEIIADGMVELHPIGAAIAVLFGLGQSNSIGTETTAETTTQPYLNVMLTSGMVRRSFPGEGWDASSLVPQVETTYVNGDGSDRRGETGLATMSNQLTARAIARGDTAANNVYFAHSGGVGGQSIASLLVGAEQPGAFGDLWQYFKLPLTSVAGLATAAGKSAAVQAVKIDQGEEDITQETPRAVFYDRTLLYMGYVTKAARDTFGQANVPLFCLGQKFAHRRLSKEMNYIALAQRDVALRNKSVMLTHPDYCLQGMQSSGLHFSPAGQRQAHSYAARAIDYVKTTGKKWRGVDVASVLWQARTIEVGINDPAGLGLVVDTDYIYAAPNLGFDIWSTSGGGYLAGAITGVTLRRSGVSLSIAAGLPADAELVAGRGRPGDPVTQGREYGPRTNIRDRYGEIDATFTGHNYLLAFSHFKTQGNFA